MPANWCERSGAAIEPLRFSLSNCSMAAFTIFYADSLEMKQMPPISLSRPLAGSGSDWTVLPNGPQFLPGFMELPITYTSIGGAQMGEQKPAQMNGGKPTQASDRRPITMWPQAI